MSKHYIAWDIGGAHLKLAVLNRCAQVVFAQQYICPLWKGLEVLTASLQQAAGDISSYTDSTHAITITGETADCFVTRQEGVDAILKECARWMPKTTAVYAGDSGWINLDQASQYPYKIASVNWHATAQCCADEMKCGILLDIGTTTTDIIPFAEGDVLCQWKGRDYTDVHRLKNSTLVYTGVVRTAVMALAEVIVLEDEVFNIVAEYFANSGDVYRILKKLPPNVDGGSSSDGAPLDRMHSLRRFARMFGMELNGNEQWLVQAASKIALAQKDKIFRAYLTVAQQHKLETACIVGAGAGSFLAREIADQNGVEYCDFQSLIKLEQRPVMNNTVSAIALAKQMANFYVTS
ncbi:MAG: hydantoinase/oxoprolinase family protein [Candidatus Oxydemutatoraceae bacterium WSBS_2016_MAG_OTU14]